MKIEFDSLADELYIQLAEGEVDKAEEIKPGMMVDYDAAGNMLGIKVLSVSKRAELPLKKAKNEQMLGEKVDAIEAFRGSSKVKGSVERLLADRRSDG